MILVTGATGTVGQHVVTELAGLDVPVRALVHDPEAVPLQREERIEVGKAISARCGEATGSR